MAIEFKVGGQAPCNQKASNSFEELCYVCGRKLGKNPLHFEVNTSWELLPVGNQHPDSQGCFPVGNECAKKFEAGILFVQRYVW
jgi:hypothetical protein